MVLICENKEKAKYVLSEMEREIKKLKLEFNQKTQIFPIKNGVEFLGFHFYVSETGKIIRKLKKLQKRFERRIKKMKNDYANGDITIEEIKRSLHGYKGHLQRGHTDRLQSYVYKDFVLRK